METHSIRFATPKAPREQLVLFPQCLDQLVAEDAPVRTFAALLDEVDWSAWEQEYEGCGQPPIHPRYLAGAILFGLLHKVRSTRELEEAACKHLDLIWLLEGFTPDHSTFAKFRQRHAQAIKDLQKQIAKVLVLKREEALLQLIIDGTRLRADSDRHGARTAHAIEMIISELERRMEELRRNDEQAALETDDFEGVEQQEDKRETLARLDKQIAQLQKQRAKYQKALGIAHKRDARAQKHDGKKAKPVRVPVTDPESHVLPNKEGGYAPNYTPVATVESQTGAIVHADVLAGSDEAGAVVPALRAAEALTGQKPDAVLSDTNFASGEVLSALDAEDIAAYMPTRSASPPDNPALRPDPSTPVSEEARKRLPKHGRQFARTAFVYNPQADVYHCPMGHALTPYRQHKNKHGVPCTYYRCNACPDCPLASDCIKGKVSSRSITRDEHEPLREAAAQRMATTEGKAIYNKRAPVIEGAFGIIKLCFGIRRFFLRGHANVRTEWTWICTAFNLKKLLVLASSSASGAPTTGNRHCITPQKRHYGRIMRVFGASFVETIRHRILRALQAPRRCPYVKKEQLPKSTGPFAGMTVLGQVWPPGHPRGAGPRATRQSRSRKSLFQKEIASLRSQ